MEKEEVEVDEEDEQEDDELDDSVELYGNGVNKQGLPTALSITRNVSMPNLCKVSEFDITPS